MDNLDCALCKKHFETDKQFNTHLKSHNITVASYYKTYFPKRDLFTGEVIEFKNKEHYFNTDFSHKNNLLFWTQSAADALRLKYIKEKLKKRKDDKELVYALSQVELNSLPYLLNVTNIQALGIDYSALCEEIGLKVKFKYDRIKIERDPSYEKTHIVVDTREQKPLNLNHKTKKGKLDYGDYSFPGSTIFIERKGMSDFISTLATQLDRFEREIQRARDNGHHLVILGEESLYRALNFDRFYYAKFTKIRPEYIFKIVRELMQKYDNIQFLFAKNRNEAARLTELILLSNNIAKDYDLQFLYECDVL